MNLLDFIAMGKRYRVTVRWLGRFSVNRIVDVYEEGIVTRYWLGWLFIKVMENDKSYRTRYE